jgi:TetR/AcrR family transcriptional regulator
MQTQDHIGTDEVHAKRARRKQARPGELLAAALDLFVEKGFAATRAEEVAAHAGVSKGTLFLYFQSKEELFKAVVRETLAGRFETWSIEIKLFEGSTADMLRYAMNEWWKHLGATKASGISKLMMSEACNFPELAEFYHQEVIVPGQKLIETILQRGIDQGEFTVTDMRYAVLGVMAPMVFLINWKHSLGMCTGLNYPIDPDQYINNQLQIMLQGLVKRTP